MIKKHLLFISIITFGLTSFSAHSQSNLIIAKNISNELETLIGYARLNSNAETETPGYEIDFELIAMELQKIKEGVDQITDYPRLVPIDPTTLKPINMEYQR